MSLLELKNLTLTYPGTEEPAVDSISLQMEQGEILALVGESGCGKSSTIRMIAGLEVPDKGEICYDGELLNKPGFAVPPEHRGVGMVFQDNALFPHMTVRENIAFGVAGDDKTAAEKMLEIVGLRELGYRYPHEISGGQMQRVALARALAPRPSLILMDEPFNNLDIRIKRALMEDISGILRDTGTACLFITHEKDEAFILADRIAVMRNGRLLQTAAPRHLYESPADTYVAEFFGRANHIPASRNPEGFETPIGPVPFPFGTGASDYPEKGFLVHRPWDTELHGSGNLEVEILGCYFFGDFQEVRFRPVEYDGDPFKFFTHITGDFKAGMKFRMDIPSDRLTFCKE
jgi:iron(III) transport system ATP-binding protein